MAYSIDLRKRALEYIQNGGSKEEAATIFGVCLKTIWNWIKRAKDGHLGPTVKEVKPRKIDNQQLLQFLKDNPDAYLREIAEEFNVSIPAVYYACNRLRVTLKKRPRTIGKETKKKEKSF